VTIVLGKLYHSLAVLSIAMVLAAGGLLGLLAGTGRLTTERLATIASLLRGEAVDMDREEAAEVAGTPAEAEPGNRSPSAEELRRQRREEQLRRALGERAYRDRLAQRELLDQALQHLITEQERFENEQARARAELERRQAEALDEGFEKELKLVSKLSPKLAKEHIILKWRESPPDAVRLLNALSESTGKRILGQMKTPEEIQIMHELLERLSEQKVDQLTPGSGKTAGN
jgi:hypothetical protein